MTDVELLEQHRHGNDQAFAQLVRSHLGWVYGVARRRVRDAHLAEDVAQAVFVLLHRKMPHFPADGAMMNWLHRAAWFAADVAVRNDQRRRHRETEAAMLQSDASSQPADEWAELAPLLDELVGKLNHADREAVLLRYYRDMTFAQVGVQIGSTEEAARKRVDRAVEKLRQMAAKHGAPISVSALSAGLLNQINIAPPSGLLATTTTIATAQTGSALAASLSPILKGASFMMASTKLMITGVVAAAVLLGSGTVWLATQSSHDTSAALAQPAPTSRPWGEGYPKLAPFSAIRWRNDTPEIHVEGTWYEWVAMNDQPIRQITDFARKVDRKDWQMRIGEDLVELMARMGNQVGDTVSLQLYTLDANPTLITLPRVPNTASNRRTVFNARIATDPAAAAVVAAAAGPNKPAYRRLAPYSAIRWHDATPEIQVNGTWYEWLGLNDLSIQQVITSAQKSDRSNWQMRVGEDLVEVLERGGVQVGDTVMLKVKPLGDNSTITTLPDVKMTAENRRAIWEQRIDSEKPASQQ